MPTTVTTTLGSSHTDPLIQTWVTTLTSANLVVADQIQEGSCYNDSEFAVAGNVALFGGGTVIDATRYILLDCGAGQSFRDNANVRTNALYYNATNGVGLRNTGSAGRTIDSHSQGGITFNGLQIQGDSGSNGALYTGQSGDTVGTTYNNCIIVGTEMVLNGPLTFNNCLIVNTQGPFTRVFSIETADTYTFKCCTFIAAPSLAFYCNFDAAATVNYTNCAFFGGGTSSFSSGSGTSNFTNCMTDITGTTGLTGSIAFSTSTGANFQSLTNDFRVKTGSTLDNGSASPVGGITTDISGFTRKANPTIGAWEVAGGGGGGSGGGGLLLFGGSVGWTPLRSLPLLAAWKVGQAIRRNATLSRRTLLGR